MQGKKKKQNLKKVEEETAAIAASAWKQALAQQDQVS
jgi:hypothetical protein